MLTLSHAPWHGSASSKIGSEGDNPHTAVATPYPAALMNSVWPT
jgi:hypothetical protein